MLINAFNKINQDKYRINLLIIGEGHERKNLEKLASKGIKQKQIFLLVKYTIIILQESFYLIVHYVFLLGMLDLPQFIV